MILNLSMLAFFNFSKDVIFMISKIDKFEKMMIFLIFISSLLILMLFSFKDKTEEKYVFSYSVVFILFNLFSMFCSSNMFYFLFFMELSLIPMCSLMNKLSKNSDKSNSIFYMYMFSYIGSLLFMYFCSKIEIIFLEHNCSSMILVDSKMIMIFSMIILMTKIPVFMMHIWLSKAHVSSAMVCSMILAGLMIKMGSFGLLKITNVMKKCFKDLSSEVCSFGLISLSYLYIVMMRYVDIKNFIALSSVSHMSMLLFLILSGKTMPMESSIFMICGHGIISFCLFYLMGLAYEFSKSRSSKMNSSMSSHSMIFSSMFVFYMIINLGIPPMIIFFSEVYMLESLVYFNVFLLPVMFICMLIPIFNFMLIVCKIYQMKKTNIFIQKETYKVYLMMILYFFMSLMLKFM